MYHSPLSELAETLDYIVFLNILFVYRFNLPSVSSCSTVEVDYMLSRMF